MVSSVITQDSIVMEYADDGDLFQKIMKHKKKGVYINERTVWKMAIQMLKGKLIYGFSE